MLATGKPQSEGQSFHRRLLSEYDTDITLDNYVAYFELKAIVKEIAQLRQSMAQQVLAATATSAAATAAVKASKRRTSSPTASASVPFVSYEEVEARGGAGDAALAASCKRRRELHTCFFVQLGKSYRKVRSCLATMEKELLQRMERLRCQTDVDIRQLPASYIPAIYLRIDAIVKYRSLNLAAFRKVLRKFLERCACDSLALQQRAYAVDALIAKSSVSQPMVDLRDMALEVIVLYGTVFKLSYEDTVATLTRFVCRNSRSMQRILPNSNTFYFANAFPHQERPGRFAVRVLAGSGSVFAEKMITEVLQCPRLPGTCCGRFANGEVAVKLPGPVRGDDTFIVQSMVATPTQGISTSDSILELTLMIHAAQLAGAARITAVVPYLAYTRNVASIAALAEMMEAMGCHHVITVDMHSEQVEGMFSVPLESISAKYEFVRYLTNLLRSEGHEFHNVTIVAPTSDSLGRAKDFADALMRYGQLDSTRQFVSVCTAVKRITTMTTAAAAAAAASAASHTASTAPGSAHLSPLLPTARRAGHARADDASASAAGDMDTVLSPVWSETASQAGGRALPDTRALATATMTPTTAACGGATAAAAAAAAAAASVTPMAASITVGSIDSSASSYVGAFTPTLADRPTAELTTALRPGVTHASVDADGKQQQHAHASHAHASSQLLTQRSSSTLGIEKALRQQEEGRGATVFTRQADDVHGNAHESIVLVGDVRDRLCILVDKVIDEAVNLTFVARSLHASGAQRIIAVVTHAVFSGLARERLIDAPIDLIVVTDSVNQDALMRDPQLARKLRVVPIAPLLARAIEKIHTENTLFTLFDK